MAAKANVPVFDLNNGIKVPSVGLGCWMGEPGGGERVEKMVKTALQHGYRHLDTAFGYGNEEHVGKAIRESGLPRNEIFLTTKLPGNYHSNPQEGLDISLRNLGLDYVDLYLMHWPQAENEKGDVLQPDEFPTFVDTWKGMEKLLETGKIKSIGVSNFSIKTLEQLLPHAKVIPVTNQVQLHPCLQQPELLEYCTARGILLTAYTPVGSGAKSPLFSDETLLSIAEKHKGTVAQVALSWGVIRGTLVIPKSENENRIIQNITLLKLDDEDMKKINGLHGQPGYKRNLFPLAEPWYSEGKIFGWTPEQLGWDYSM